MSSLTDEEKRDFLLEAQERKVDFERLQREIGTRVLTPAEYVEFLDFVQPFMKEDVSERGPITGDKFLL